jgi:Fic family protein
MGDGLFEMDSRAEALQYHLQKCDPGLIAQFNDMLDLSWVYHDCALEGVVLTHQELRDALDQKPVTDATTAHAFEEVRRLKQAIVYVRETAPKKKIPLTLDLFKQIYCILDPEEQNPRAVKYRKDIPLHRMYFHEITPPEKISYRMRKLQEFIQEEEEEKTHPIKFASRVHFRFLGIFPFSQHSGRVARLMTNLILLRFGYVPGVIHAIERQRYYESLRGPVQSLIELVRESVQATLEAHEKYFRVGIATLPTPSSTPPPATPKRKAARG